MFLNKSKFEFESILNSNKLNHKMIFEPEQLFKDCNKILCEENQDKFTELYRDFELCYSELLKYEGLVLGENAFVLEFLRTKAQKCLLSKQISTDELIITRCFPSSKVVRADIEYMHSIPDGRLENWETNSGKPWDFFVRTFICNFNKHLPGILAYLEDIIESTKDKNLMDDLYIMQDIILMCITNECEIIINTNNKKTGRTLTISL
jgi:hypothetical protein